MPDTTDDGNPLRELVGFVDDDELVDVRRELSTFRAEMNGELEEAELYRTEGGELEKEQFTDGTEGDDGAAR